jgi:hypothetical protein
MSNYLFYREHTKSVLKPCQLSLPISQQHWHENSTQRRIQRIDGIAQGVSLGDFSMPFARMIHWYGTYPVLLGV